MPLRKMGGAPLQGVYSHVHLILLLDLRTVYFRDICMSDWVSTLRICLFLSNAKSKQIHLQHSVWARHAWQVGTTIAQSATHQNDKNDTDLSPGQG